MLFGVGFGALVQVLGFGDLGFAYLVRVLVFWVLHFWVLLNQPEIRPKIPRIFCGDFEGENALKTGWNLPAKIALVFQRAREAASHTPMHTASQPARHPCTIPDHMASDITNHTHTDTSAHHDST